MKARPIVTKALDPWKRASFLVRQMLFHICVFQIARIEGQTNDTPHACCVLRLNWLATEYAIQMRPSTSTLADAVTFDRCEAPTLYAVKSIAPVTFRFTPPRLDAYPCVNRLNAFQELFRLHQHQLFN